MIGCVVKCLGDSCGKEGKRDRKTEGRERYGGVIQEEKLAGQIGLGVRATAAMIVTHSTAPYLPDRFKGPYLNDKGFVPLDDQRGLQCCVIRPVHLDPGGEDAKTSFSSGPDNRGRIATMT